MKKQILFILIFSLGFVSLNTLLANTFQSEKNVTITADVNDDLYLASDNILVDAIVRGDLVAAGGNITIQDTITQDVIMVGGNLKVLGYVGDDVRVGGGTIFINSTINGDLIVAGGEVTVGKEAVVNGEIHMVGGALTMNGSALDQVNIRGGEVIWNGRAENELTVKAGSLEMNGTVRGTSMLAAQDINIGPAAQLFGNVEYWNSEGELDFGDALLAGASSTYKDDLKVYDSDVNWSYLGLGMLAFWLYRLFAGAVMIALLIWMFHNFFSRNGAEANQNYLNHLGLGLLYVVGLPILIVLTFMTVIGIPVGFVLMIMYLLTIALGHILASLLIAYAWNNYYEKNWNRPRLFLAAMLSFFALKIMALIPFLGALVSVLVVMAAFGTILRIWRQTRRMRRQAV